MKFAKLLKTPFLIEHLWRLFLFTRMIKKTILNENGLLHSHTFIWDKVFKSGLSKFIKGYLPQNFLTPVLNTVSYIINAIQSIE